MNEQETFAEKKNTGPESLHILLRSWRDGTFSEILDDWKWILAYTRRYRRAAAAYTVLGIAGATLSLVSALASKHTIDIITGYDSSRLWFVLTVMVVSALSSLLLRSVTSRISTKISLWVNNDIQAEVFDRLLAADWQGLNRYPSGDLLNRLAVDAGTVAGNAIHWLPDLIVAGYTFAATLAVILHYDWIMALLALASAPALLLGSRRLVGGIRAYQKKVRQCSSRLMAYESETFHNLDAIKGFGIAGLYSSGLRQRQEEYRKTSLDANLFSIRAQAALSLFGSAAQMTAFCYCLYLLWSGKILYGTMTLFLSQGTKLNSAFNSLVRTVPNFLNASVSARRIRELYALEPEPELPGSETLEKEAARGFTVCVEHAGYAYRPGEPVLRDAALLAAPGEIVALVGPSGGGKTTLCNLIPRFYEVTGGRILIDGQDIQHVTLKSLREDIGIVQQDVYLFSGSVADNIAYGKPGATREEIIEAARLAGAERFISALKDGFDTYVGERGVKLSGGQKQRIAIARVFLKNPPILILDEATSALDNESEILVGQSLEKLAHGRTTLTIAHRLTTIKDYDRILVLGAEGIEESGTHDELLAKKGVYYRLWNQLPGEDTL